MTEADLKRAIFLENRKEILSQKVYSEYFEDFFQSGFLTFLYLTTSNSYHFPKQNIILNIANHSKTFEEFRMSFFSQSAVSYLELLNHFMKSIEIFLQYPIHAQMFFIALACNSNISFLEDLPLFMEDIWSYIVPADHWSLLLEQIILKDFLFYDINYESIANELLFYMGSYPSYVKESILINLGLHYQINVSLLNEKKTQFHTLVLLCQQEAYSFFQEENLKRLLIQF